MEVVAVRVDDEGVPHVIAYEGFLRIEIARAEFVVKSDGVVALEAQRDAFVAVFFEDTSRNIFLEHEGGTAEV